MTYGIAFLHTTLKQEDGWRQVLPAGHFRANDGRPEEPALKKGWFLDKANALRLIEQVKAKGKVMVDYEHAYLHAALSRQKGEEPKPVIASGWIHGDDIRWHDEDGLLVKPRWTKTAKAHIDDDEIADLSALFTYDKETGIPTTFLNVALTNDPALTLKGLTNYAALSRLAALNNTDLLTNGDNSMNEYLLMLLAALGLEATEENVAEVTEKAVEKINQLIAKEASADEKIADLTSKQVDPLKFVPREALTEAQAKIAALSSQSTAGQSDALIEKGRKEGRVMASEVQNLKDVAKTHGIAMLSTMINSRAPIAALTSESQIADDVVKAAVEAAKNELSEEEKEAARMLDITEAEYLEMKLKESNEEAK